MTTTPTIGNLDARRWIGRRVRIMSPHRGPGHAMRGTLIAIEKDRAVVKPAGHRHTDTVPLSAVHPWWAQNPDLKALAEAKP